MSDSATHSIFRILVSIRDELRRTVDFEISQRQQEQATLAMRRAGAAVCGSCLFFSPASWEWMKARGRTQPYVKSWAGHCTAQSKSPTRKSSDPTERQENSPPCIRYVARWWPDGSPIDPQEESNER